MNHLKMIKIIAGFVFTAGLMVMISWIFDINFLKNISPLWPTMKFLTAFCFVMSAVTLYFIVQMFEENKEIAQLVLSSTCFIILFIMLTFSASIILGIHTGLEDFFIRRPDMEILAVKPGFPSAGTIINFILIAVSGIIVILNRDSALKALPILGLVMAALGAAAIGGYIFNIPLFYYDIEGLSSAMALHTAILFVLLGLGLILTGKIK